MLGLQISRTRTAVIVEESIVDPKAKVMTTYTKNISLPHIMMVEERCTYEVAPTNPAWCVHGRTALTHYDSPHPTATYHISPHPSTTHITSPHPTTTHLSPDTLSRIGHTSQHTSGPTVSV